MSLRNVLGQIARFLDHLLSTPAEQRYWEECDTRPALSDTEFYETYYRGSGIPSDVISTVRRVFADQLDLTKVIPSDVLGPILPDIDFWEVMVEIAEDLGFDPATDNSEQLDGTFDSFVRWAARRCQSRVDYDR
jgi:hypothetical protein